MIRADYLGVELEMNRDGDMFINDKSMSWQELMMLRSYLDEFARMFTDIKGPKVMLEQQKQLEELWGKRK